MTRKKVVIIGAGIGGLGVANLLAKAGYEVHVYEKSTQAGGRAGRKIEHGFTFDTGPSWYLMPEVFAHYYQLLGESVDALLNLKKLTPAYKVFFERFIKSNQGDISYDESTVRQSVLEEMENFSSQAHHLGTTRMSDDASKGVVDSNCKVHGISNLYIAGSSVFPTGSHANPTLTLIALTLRLANHIKRLNLSYPSSMAQTGEASWAYAKKNQLK